MEPVMSKKSPRTLLPRIRYSDNAALIIPSLCDQPRLNSKEGGTVGKVCIPILYTTPVCSDSSEDLSIDWQKSLKTPRHISSFVFLEC